MGDVASSGNILARVVWVTVSTMLTVCQAVNCKLYILSPPLQCPLLQNLLKEDKTQRQDRTQVAHSHTAGMW